MELLWGRYYFFHHYNQFENIVWPVAGWILFYNPLSALIRGLLKLLCFFCPLGCTSSPNTFCCMTRIWCYNTTRNDICSRMSWNVARLQVWAHTTDIVFCICSLLLLCLRCCMFFPAFPESQWFCLVYSSLGILRDIQAFCPFSMFFLCCWSSPEAHCQQIQHVPHCGISASVLMR